MDMDHPWALEADNVVWHPALSRPFADNDNGTNGTNGTNDDNNGTNDTNDNNDAMSNHSDLDDGRIYPDTLDLPYPRNPGDDGYWGKCFHLGWRKKMPPAKNVLEPDVDYFCRWCNKDLPMVPTFDKFIPQSPKAGDNQLSPSPTRNPNPDPFMAKNEAGQYLYAGTRPTMGSWECTECLEWSCNSCALARGIDAVWVIEEEEPVEKPPGAWPEG